ncbi:MAG: hypothetical protein ACE37F_18870 [Nannocystaceae bacterium]|nr:hypothetical protein [bacterium]
MRVSDLVVTVSLPLAVAGCVGPAAPDPTSAEMGGETDGASTGDASMDGSSSSGGQPEDAQTSSTSTGAALPCPDVAGEYAIALENPEGSPCTMLLEDGNLCSVGQDACELTWSCDSPHAKILTPGPLDMEGTYTAEGTYVNHTYACTFAFASDLETFAWTCTIGTENPTSCTGTGTRTE